MSRLPLFGRIKEAKTPCDAQHALELIKKETYEIIICVIKKYHETVLCWRRCNNLYSRSIEAVESSIRCLCGWTDCSLLLVEVLSKTACAIFLKFNQKCYFLLLAFMFFKTNLSSVTLWSDLDPEVIMLQLQNKFPTKLWEVVVRVELKKVMNNIIFKSNQFAISCCSFSLSWFIKQELYKTSNWKSLHILLYVFLFFCAHQLPWHNPWSQHIKSLHSNAARLHSYIDGYNSHRKPNIFSGLRRVGASTKTHCSAKYEGL